MANHICVIGTGYWGKNLVRNFAQLNVLAGICDTSSTRADQIAGEFGCQSFSFQELLDNQNIDGVAIATPAETHFEVVRRAILANKDVLVEKPLTLCVEQGEQLIRLAAEKRRVLMVDHLLEYHPAIIEAKQLIDRGELGTVEYIYSNRLNMGKVRREENSLWSFAPHDLSVIMMLLGGELPEEVSATGGAYLQPGIHDTTLTALKFSTGVRAHVFVSWLHPYKEQKLVVIGSKAMIEFNDLSDFSKLSRFSRKITLVDGNYAAHRPEREAVPIAEREPLNSVCTEFIRCIQTRETPKADGHDGLRVLRVLNAAQRSLDAGGIPAAVKLKADKAASHANS